MKFPFSFGKIEIKYFIMIGIAFSFQFLRKNYTLYSEEKAEILKKKYFTEEEKNNGKNLSDNKLLKSLLKYIGFSLMIIGDLILKKIAFKNNKGGDFLKKAITSKSFNLTKEDSKSLIKKRDILFIILIAISHLAHEFIAILIKTISKSSYISIDEQYVSIEFIFLFCTSFFIFKLNYYKHQYITIIIIISLEIFRLLIKSEYKELLERTGLQIIRAILDSLFVSYSKGLIEYKYFSPYKALYIFGFINGLIMLIIYIIFTYVPVDSESKFCSLKYKNKCYFDNFISIFEGFNFTQFFGLFCNMVSSTGIQLIFNIISKDYTICHIFTYYSLSSLYELTKKNDKIVLIFGIISNILEILMTFVFLEIIILNFCGLNENVKINIEKRAEEDISYTEDNIRQSSFGINDEYDINYEDIEKGKKSIKLTPLMPINDEEENEE